MLIRSLKIIDEAAPTLRPEAAGTTVWRDDDGTIVALSASVGSRRWLKIEGAGSYSFSVEGVSGGVNDVGDAGLDSGQASAFPVVAAEVVPLEGADMRVVTDSYYRSVVPLALQAAGCEVLHGSAVALAGRIVAMCARRESGKSTLAFALERRGAAAVADDAVVVDLGRDQGDVRPRVLSLPFALRLREASADFFDAPSKASVLLDGPVQATPAEPLPLTAVVLLERRAGDVRLQRIGAPEAFPALLSHAHAYSLAETRRKRAMMANYLDLARSTPVYGLTYPTGLEHLDEICELLERLAGAPDDGSPRTQA